MAGVSTEMKGERIERALPEALKAHNSDPKSFSIGKYRRSDPQEVYISFAGSGSVKDWYSERNFGEQEIDLDLFPSLKNIGGDVAAQVNEAFQKRFKEILEKSSLKTEVEQAMNKGRQIVFAGHSSGGPIAILATLWTLENYLTPKSRGGIPPLCVTFGSPLVGNHIFSHATIRQIWSQYFLHYVMRHDIVPRILLAPLSSFDQRCDSISQSFNNPRSRSFLDTESLGQATATLTLDFYFAIMSNASTVISHAASKLMGTTDTALETLTNFIPLSPYRPFGTYVFCTEKEGSGKQVVISNPDAILQVLFYSAQLTQEEADNDPHRSLKEHKVYGTKVPQSLGSIQKLGSYQLKNLSLSQDDTDLGLSTRARVSLQAAAELEARRYKNEEEIKNKKEKKPSVVEIMNEVKKYKDMWKSHKKGYYDGFREHKTDDDFQANVKRLQMAGVWDEIIEKLRNYELPHEFEGKQEWIDFGTEFRKLSEPLDIANYYRHSRNYEGKGKPATYMEKGRPSRYRYPQKWLNHRERRTPKVEYSESCFWAEVEELRNEISISKKSFEEIKERVVELESQIKAWKTNGELDDDVFLEGSTLVKWWKGLPQDHRAQSCIKDLIK